MPLSKEARINFAHNFRILRTYLDIVSPTERARAQRIFSNLILEFKEYAEAEEEITRDIREVIQKLDDDQDGPAEPGDAEIYGSCTSAT